MTSSLHRGKKIFGFLFIVLLISSLCNFSLVFSSVLPSFVRLSPISAQIQTPTAIALDGAGRLYVAEASVNSVKVFSQSGHFISSLSGLDKPVSIAVDAGGRIFVGNADKGNVAVFDSSFVPLFKLGKGDGEFGLPMDIAIDGVGKVYVVDKENNAVRIYNTSGEFVTMVGTQGSGAGQLHHPVSIAIDTVSNELVILDHQEVYDTWSNAMIDGARLQFFDMSGTLKRDYDMFGYDIAAGELVVPIQVTVDAVSRVYVTDSRLQKVMVYDNQGVFLGQVDSTESPLRTPLGITIGSSNRLYIASLLAHQVEVYGMDHYSVMNAVPAEFSFSAIVGGNPPPPQSLTIYNDGVTTFYWSASAALESPWASLAIQSGTLEPSAIFSQDVSVTVDGLAAGQYQSSILLANESGVSEKIPLTLTVLSNPLTVSPDGLFFDVETGTAVPGQELSVATTGDGLLSWHASSDSPWLAPSKTTGITPDSLRVDVDGSGLAVGTHTGRITFTGDDDTFVAIGVDVVLHVSESVSPPPIEHPLDSGTGDGSLVQDKWAWVVSNVLTGTSLNGVWGSESRNVYVVGDNGSILHYDGKQWGAMDSSISTGNLYSIWGSSDTDIYAVGDNGLVLHFDGKRWSSIAAAVTADALQDVWGGGGEVAAVSTSGLVLENGLSTSSATGVALRSLWGSSETDVFAAGESGAVFHFDGKDWSPMNSGTEELLNSVWGSSADNVIAVGGNGVIVHYDGNTWSTMESGTKETLTGVWGMDMNSVFAVGAKGTVLYYNGSAWHTADSLSAGNLHDVWISARGMVFAVGDDGTVVYGRVRGFPWNLILNNIFNNSVMEKKKVSAPRQ
ncbi:MAG: 6-bladed beta-propeller [Proteobacteria bacterium]|nr:6-bladed beta-propeller [Pseudomonadota bacterium]